MQWTQIYDPFGHWWLSMLVAADYRPFRDAGRFQVEAPLVRYGGCVDGLNGGNCLFQMPRALAVSSFGYGVAFTVLKIAWIVLAAVYLYDISVETGQFEIMKESVAGITSDRRLQLLLVALFLWGVQIALIHREYGSGTQVQPIMGNLPQFSCALATD